MSVIDKDQAVEGNATGAGPVDAGPFGNYVASEVELTAERLGTRIERGRQPCRRNMAFPPFESSDIIEFKLWTVGIGSWLGPPKGYFQGQKGR
jgi:hypothetical protein